MFDLSLGETIFVLGFAFVAFGKKETSIIAKSAGYTVGRAVRLFQKGSKEFSEFADKTDLTKVHHEVQQSLRDLNEIRSEIRGGVSLSNPGPIARYAMAAAKSVNPSLAAALPSQQPSSSSSQSDDQSVEPRQNKLFERIVGAIEDKPGSEPASLFSPSLSAPLSSVPSAPSPSPSSSSSAVQFTPHHLVNKNELPLLARVEFGLAHPTLDDGKILKTEMIPGGADFVSESFLERHYALFEKVQKEKMMASGANGNNANVNPIALAAALNAQKQQQQSQNRNNS